METISICIPSHNTLSRGAEVLERTINSISEAIKCLYYKKKDLKVIILWVDDASTDGTLDEVKRLRSIQEPYIKNNFFITQIAVNRGQSYCRNHAASLYNSDYICFFDSDDEMYKNHLILCADMMDYISPDNKKVAMGSTCLETNYKLHPNWIKRISYTAPITKIIRREAWEFIEGMPTDFLYKKIGGEDAAFRIIFSEFFGCCEINTVTAKYWDYPDSALGNQIEKFKNEPNEKSGKFETISKDQEKLRVTLIQQRLEYLKRKTILFNLSSEFDHLIKHF